MSSTPFAAVPSRIPSLDGLRGIAALTVFVSHYSNRTDLWDGFAGRGAGQLGVMLFFALSSFLMFYLYFGQQRPKLQLIRNFAVSRAARVLPLFFFVIVVSFLLRAAGIVEGYVITPENIFRHFALVQGNEFLWTIGPEIVFYLFFALLLIPPRTWAVTFLLSLILLALMLSESIVGTGLGRSSNNLVRSFYAYKFFIVGPIVLFAVSQLKEHRILETWQLPGWIVAIAVVALWFLHYPRIHEAVFGFVLPRNGWNSTQMLIVVGFILFCSIQNPTLRAVLATRPLMFLGQISYSVYLTHIFVLQLLIKYNLLLPSAIGLLLCAALVIAVSAVTYRLIELPSRQYLRRFLVSDESGPGIAPRGDTALRTPTVSNQG